MSLPDSWVERIFNKLSLVYGHQFLSRWDGLPMADVRADWGRELSRFQQNPAAITYALEHLPPGKPPTVLEFRSICNSPQAPVPERMLALPDMLEHDDIEARRTLERLALARAQIPDCDGFAWAFGLELKDREDPHKVSPTVRATYREALGNWRRMHGGAIPQVQRHVDNRRAA